MILSIVPGLNIKSGIISQLGFIVNSYRLNMNLPAQLASHFRAVHFGGNWTSVNLKEQLANVDWQMATKQIDSFNTIAKLVFHINYYVEAVLGVFQGNPLNAKDAYSFDLPAIQSEQEWQALLEKTFREAETFANQVEQLPEEKLSEDFIDKKYGNYYRNIAGITEHIHYHLGQIVILKKLIQSGAMVS